MAIPAKGPHSPASVALRRHTRMRTCPIGTANSGLVVALRNKTPCHIADKTGHLLREVRPGDDRVSGPPSVHQQRAGRNGTMPEAYTSGYEDVESVAFAVPFTSCARSAAMLSSFVIRIRHPYADGRSQIWFEARRCLQEIRLLLID